MTSEICEVGNHPIEANDHHRCAYCNRKICTKHMGNPDAYAGSYVACIDHVEEVKAMQTQIDSVRLKRQSDIRIVEIIRKHKAEIEQAIERYEALSSLPKDTLARKLYACDAQCSLLQSILDEIEDKENTK